MRLRRNAITHAIEDEGQYFMVDWGGGSTILHQLKHAGYDWMDMRHIFVTHKHVWACLGVLYSMSVSPFRM